jgi:hypothetical protein
VRRETGTIFRVATSNSRARLPYTTPPVVYPRYLEGDGVLFRQNVRPDGNYEVSVWWPTVARWEPNARPDGWLKASPMTEAAARELWPDAFAAD